MTLQELYRNIDGDYDQALRVLRMDRLIDKHIRRFKDNAVVAELLSAGESMDPTLLFEKAHAVKGVTANLGLTVLSGLASEITEEYRPGNERSLSDEEVKERLIAIDELYRKTAEGIAAYEAET